MRAIFRFVCEQVMNVKKKYVLRRVRGVPWALRSWLDGYKNKLCECCWFPSACSPEMTTGPSLNARSSSRMNSLGWNDSPAAKRNQQRDRKRLAFTHNVFCLVHGQGPSSTYKLIFTVNSSFCTAKAAQLERIINNKSLIDSWVPRHVTEATKGIMVGFIYSTCWEEFTLV